MDTTQHDAGPGVLSAEMMAVDPMTQFARWMADAQARPLPEPTVTAVASHMAVSIEELSEPLSSLGATRASNAAADSRVSPITACSTAVRRPMCPAR